MKEINDVLNDLEEDVITNKISDDTSNSEDLKNNNEIQNKVYFQQKEYFVETTEDKLVSVISKNSDQLYPFPLTQLPLQSLNSAIDIAILFQSNSHILSNLCYGLLGGISLMQLVLTYTLVKGSKHEIISFIELYSKFDYVPSASFSILTSMCLIFALDKIDLLTIKQATKVNEDVVCNWILLFLYSATFILSVLSFKYDEIIAMYPDTKNIISISDDLRMWKTLNVWRCIFGIIGWFFVCIMRPRDFLKLHLHSIKYNQNP